MKKKVFLVLSFVLLITGGLFAQEDQKSKSVFTLDAELRPRTEMYLGYKTLALENQVPGIITNQRSRLNFNYKSDKMLTKLVLQDVRIWGSQAQLVKNEDFGVSIHEAWGEMFFTDAISLKAGRMEIIYDDHRIFGSVGWAPQARSHDAAFLKYTTEKIHLHFGGALYNENINNNFYEAPNAYKAFQVMHFNYNSNPINFSFLFLNNGKQENEYSRTYDNILNGNNGSLVGQSTVYSQTIGAFFKYKQNDFFLIASGYYQMGKNPANWATAADSIPTGMAVTDGGYKSVSGQGQKIAAYEFNVEIGYKMPFNLLVATGVEVLSGNSFSMDNVTNGSILNTNNVQNAFTPFYGTNHKFNGWMDYFYVGNHVGSIGLMDIYGKFIYKKDKFFVKLIPHYFISAGEGAYSTMHVDNSTGDISYSETKFKGALGTEIDIWAGYTIAPGASIQFGYSYMLPTANMKALKLANADATILGVQNWAWVMLSFKPSLIKHIMK